MGLRCRCTALARSSLGGGGVESNIRCSVGGHFPQDCGLHGRTAGSALHSALIEGDAQLGWPRMMAVGTSQAGTCPQNCSLHGCVAACTLHAWGRAEESNGRCGVGG